MEKQSDSKQLHLNQRHIPYHVIMIIWSFIAMAPVWMLLINTLIFHGTKPLFSIVISAFVQILIVALCAVLTVVYLISGKKEETGA